MKITEIKSVFNYYGHLNVCANQGKYYWIVENYDTDFSNLSEWSEISKRLYDMIIQTNQK